MKFISRHSKADRRNDGTDQERSGGSSSSRRLHDPLSLPGADSLPWLGHLFVLPLFAIWVGRPLVLGAYDLASSGEAFFVGIAYGLAGGTVLTSLSFALDAA